MFRTLSMLLGIVVTSLPAAAQDASAYHVYAMTADGSGAWDQAWVPEYPIINSPELSPDGTRVAVDGWRHDQSLQDAHLLIIDLETGRYDDLGPGAMPNWSPDGTRIAYSKYHPARGVYISRADGGDERLIDPRGWALQWSPDPNRLAYVLGGNLIVYEISTDSRREVFPGGTSPYRTIFHNCTWSPDGTQICFRGRRSDGTDELAVVSVSGEPNLRVLCNAEDINPDIAWHPDGTRIVVPRKSRGGVPGQLLVLDPARATSPTRLPGQPEDRHNGGVCWSRDGQTLIFVSRAMGRSRAVAPVRGF